MSFFLLILLFDFSQALAFEGSDFAYFKKITGEAKQGIVALKLDRDVYEHSNYADLVILDDEEKIQPSKLINTDFGLISTSTKILDSTLAIGNFKTETFISQNLFDGNLQTSYEAITDNWNSELKAYKAYLLLDFGEEREIKVIDFVLTKFAKYWYDIEVEASLDNDNFKKVINNATLDKYLYFKNLKTRYLKITFWYPEVLSIAEISVYEKENPKILFNYDPAKTYRIFYGNIQQTEKENVNLTYSANLPLLTLSAEENNPNYNTDFDSDGVLNEKDNCPLEANSKQIDTDKDKIGDVCDSSKFMNDQNEIDLDFDGIGQSSDNCPFVKNSDQSDKNQNGIGDLCDDDDSDGVINILDNCPVVRNFDQLDEDQNRIGDVCAEDSDQDGIPQNIDNCKNVANSNQLDSDKDTIGDACDNCPNVSNYNQIDENQNDMGDVCEDFDNDGVINSKDNCQKIANPDQIDSDGDTIGDICDNCPKIKNISQWDDDGDGVGNGCDDDDGDGIVRKNDNCPNHKNPDQLDSDQNGVGDMCEDYDKDGIIDLADNCVKVVNPDQIDEDKDGIGDVCDSRIVLTEPPYLFYGLTGLILFGILYYLIKLTKQILEFREF